MTHSPGKPLLTANQVTFARLALLPIGSWLLYQGVRGQWVALVFMTIVGCTDFVDGWLARKYGPTVLGGLMDPIADKVFVAVTFLPMIDLGWLPGYIVGLLFVREFVVTAARTAYERRKVSLKTSYLAKVKTWFQMCAGALIFLYRTVQDPRAMDIVVIAIWALPVLGGVVQYAIKRRVWRGIVVWFFAWGALAAATIAFGGVWASIGVGWAVLAITFASGGAYLVGMKDLPGTGRVDLHDVVRLFGSFTLPALVAALLVKHHALREAFLTGHASAPAWPAWPIITAISIEFAIGGLDNLLAHNKQLPGWPGWLARVGAQAVLLGAALAIAVRDPASPLVQPLTMATLAITLTSAAIVFYRNRAVYLGDLEKAPTRPAADSAR